MSRLLGRHVTYANVVATLALLFALSGSAIAADRYLISSDSQISPRAMAGIVAEVRQQSPATVAAKKAPKAKLSSEEIALLNKILPHMAYASEGIDARPTLRFSGVNVQVLSGAGKEDDLNGEGNLIVGYDEQPREQTGSNNLILGTFEQEYTSVGGMLAGEENTVEGEYASVSGGYLNTAAADASVSGGSSDIASHVGSSVSGGALNVADDESSSVAGGIANTAAGDESTVSGGEHNTASEYVASVTGGAYNVASVGASVNGGEHNTASGPASSIGGGVSGKAIGKWDTIAGGYENTAEGTEADSIAGGFMNLVSGKYQAWVGGGGHNDATASYAAIFGGHELIAGKEFEALP